MIFLERGGERRYKFLRAINKANEGGPRIGQGRQVAGLEGGMEGTKIACVSCSSVNTIQQVIVKMVLVPGNSVVSGKKVTLYLKQRLG